VSRAFDYVSDLRNMEVWWPEHVRYYRLYGKGDTGTRYGWVYLVRGLPVLGLTRVDAHQPGARFAYHVRILGVRLSLDYSFSPEDEGTRISLLLRSIITRSSFAVRELEPELERALSRLSSILVA